MMSFDLSDVAGIIGATIVIVAYFGTQQRWFSADDWPFPLTNLVGAGFIVVSLISHWNLASFVIEVFWILISLYGLAQTLHRSSR